MMKALEIWTRSAIRRMLLPRTQPMRVSAGKAVWTLGHPPTSILLLRQDRIGDVLISTPVLRELRTRFPAARIDMLLSTNNLAVRKAVEPFVDNVHVYRKSAAGFFSVLKSIRRGSYEVVIDLMDNPSTTSTMLVLWSKAQFKLGIEKSNASVYTHVVPMCDREHVHISRRIAELLVAFDINPDDVDLRPTYRLTGSEQMSKAKELGIVIGDGRSRLGINASGSGPGRNYEAEKTVHIIKQLQDFYPDLLIYVFSDKTHEDWKINVARATGAVPVPTSPDFHQACVAMSLMDALWTPDTSVVHLAAAWNIPVCVMYVHTHSHLMPWFPVGVWYQAVTTNTSDISNIPESEVLEALSSLCAYCKFPSKTP